MAELGFFGANLEGYGCAGMSNTEYGLIMQEIERGDSGLRSFVSVQGALVMYPIYTYGSDEQKNRWLPRLQSGQSIGCFGLDRARFRLEPRRHAHHGARAMAMRWVLNGEKTWITNGGVAEIAIVWARTEAGIEGFLVERGTPGFLDVRHSRQMVDARFGDLEPRRSPIAACPNPAAFPTRAASKRRFRVSRRRATASAGASSAPPWIATKPRAPIP